MANSAVTAAIALGKITEEDSDVATAMAQTAAKYGEQYADSAFKDLDTSLGYDLNDYPEAFKLLQ
jgi:hypothetical protein